MHQKLLLYTLSIHATVSLMPPGTQLELCCLTIPSLHHTVPQNVPLYALSTQAWGVSCPQPQQLHAHCHHCSIQEEPANESMLSMNCLSYISTPILGLQVSIKLQAHLSKRRRNLVLLQWLLLQKT